MRLDGNVTKYRRIAATLFLVALLGVGVWQATHPETSDPRSIRYVLWTAGFSTLDPDTATETMIGDQTRDCLVLGRSRSQLRDKFGYLVSFREASPYLRSCASAVAEKDILFIRRSPWMVIFEKDTAIDLVLFKGC